MENEYKVWIISIALIFIAIMFSDYCQYKIQIEQIKLQQMIYSNDGVK